MINSSGQKNNKTPYKLITVSDGQIIERSVNKNSDFDVILLMDSKKVIIVDKNFENSLFLKLIVERSNETEFEMIYKTDTAVVWQPKK